MGALQGFFVLLAAAAVVNAGVYEVNEPTDWFQNTCLYQIWPRSFKDSDGDGIGDLNGITSKLYHLVDLGAGAVWLNPIYTSPMVDSGYDISDFYAINPTYGTLDDFDALVERATELGIKVLMDFVPNHVSDQHPWYIAAKAGEEPYVDYFIWNEGILVDGVREPPNNWLNMFNSGSTWLWVEERDAYVYHQFNEAQIDLNFSNPAVVQEMKDVIDYWFNRGLSGFRVDAVPFLIEDPLLRDEPLSGMDVASTNYFYHNHPYTKDLQETYDVFKELTDHVAEYNANADDGLTRALFTEGYSNISYIMKYYDYGVQVPFNFFFIKNGEIANDAEVDTASDIVSIVDTWMTNLPADQSSNWVLGNHDVNRLATRFGEQRGQTMLMMMLILPGVAVIYSADEYGMIDTFLTWEETTDIRACATDEDTYTLYSRDPVRSPFQWDNSTSAGFSTNSTTEIKVNDNYLTVNLAAQKEADVSYYKNTQAAIALRSSTVLQKGYLDIQTLETDVIAVQRVYDGENSITMLGNWNLTDEVTVSLETLSDCPSEVEVLIADVWSGITVGDIWDSTSITLPAGATVVLKAVSED